MVWLLGIFDVHLSVSQHHLKGVKYNVEYMSINFIHSDELHKTLPKGELINKEADLDRQISNVAQGHEI